jgi:hypothetical protein
MRIKEKIEIAIIILSIYGMIYAFYKLVTLE